MEELAELTQEDFGKTFVITKNGMIGLMGRLTRIEHRHPNGEITYGITPFNRKPILVEHNGVTLFVEVKEILALRRDQITLYWEEE